MIMIISPGLAGPILAKFSSYIGACSNTIIKQLFEQIIIEQLVEQLIIEQLFEILIDQILARSKVFLLQKKVFL